MGVEHLLYRYGRARGAWKLHRMRSAAAPEEAIRTLQGKRLIFSLSAGRTGSEFLTRLLALLPDTASLHEPEPAFQRMMRPALTNPALAREFLQRYKLPALAAHPESTVVETSHVFCKGFVEPLLELDLLPAVVILRRHPRAVAISYLERYTVPGRTRYGWQFLLQPSDPGVLHLPGWHSLTDYQLCYWYALETERRIAHYENLLTKHGAIIVGTSASALNQREEFLRVASLLHPEAESLNLDRLGDAHTAIAAKKHNANPRRLTDKIDFDQEEAEVWRLLGDKGVDLKKLVNSQYQE